MSKQEMDLSGNIKVCVRVRPFNRRELDQNEALCVSMHSGTVTVVRDIAGNEKTFNFDRAYWSYDVASQDYASQATLMEELGNDLLSNVLEGYNVCLFAYGQTGSGKTYSVLGNTADPQQRGLLPRIVEGLYEEIANRSGEGSSFTCSVTYMEIYNEKLRDLLRPPHAEGATDLKIHQSPNIGVYVQGLTDAAAFSHSDVQQLLDFGFKARTVGATSMNDQSSRSHCIFALEVKQVRPREQGGTTQLRCKVNLVDLAGSERQQKTQATGARLKEGSMINQSLTNLALVIHKLAQISEKVKSPPKSGKSKGPSEFVPYRNSKLTHVLQDSLSGNSKTVMMAAISPAQYNHDETVSTLRFAESVKAIKTKAKKNEETQENLVASLKAEVDRLRAQIQDGRAGVDELSAVQCLAEKYGRDVETEMKMAKEQQEYRKAALADMGLTISEVSECFGVDHKTPQLVNCGVDAQLSSNLVYFLQSGDEPVSIGEATSNNIVLADLGGVETAALISNQDDVNLVLERVDGRVLINGLHVDRSCHLRHGDRVSIGYSWTFRLVVPAASNDREHYDWEKRCLASKLSEHVPEDSELYHQCWQVIDHLADDVGTTRALSFFNDLQKTMKLVDEANILINKARRKERMEYSVEMTRKIFTSECVRPETTIRLQQGETGLVRWRNVVKRKVIFPRRPRSVVNEAMSTLTGMKVGVPPAEFCTLAIFTLSAFRRHVTHLRTAATTAEDSNQEDICGIPSFSEKMNITPLGKTLTFASDVDRCVSLNISHFRRWRCESDVSDIVDEDVWHMKELHRLRAENEKQAQRLEELEKTAACKLLAPPVHVDSDGVSDESTVGGVQTKPDCKPHHPRKLQVGEEGLPVRAASLGPDAASDLARKLLSSLQDKRDNLKTHMSYLDQLRGVITAPVK
eukprot:TRINITY_DN11474_c0_g1_i1.p1 TRINITY_DN11474_c0_g1~~TRINITY_DN11474_c0_g1_i1.p1  ORF type:complete len:915 (-),score=157.78 TRINITY_DN11474_c0_g1_i1:191-2935(-)